MIRSGKWKLWVDQEFSGREVNVAPYDLEADPQELHDLAGDPGREEIRQRLLDRVLNGWDPDMVRNEAVRSLQDYRLVAQWGKATLPELAETMEAPPTHIEQDVEIL